MNILYIDPVFGISGDMMISAFIDAGMPFEELDALFKEMPLQMPSIKPVRKRQGVMEGTYIDIEKVDTHLSIPRMKELIEGLHAEESIKEDAKGMLDIIVEAESRVHGISREEVHLHELSHIDTLLDFLSVAKGMHHFGIERVYSGPIPLGRGTIKTAHGLIPNPAPATVEILSGHRVIFADESMELTTPTGATIVRHYVKNRNPAPPFQIHRIGCGLGTYETDRPDLLRIFIGTAEEPCYEQEVWIVESDIDDMEMEYMGAIAERIRSEGALDVLYFPVHMKKGRVGIRLSVTATDDRLQHLLDLVFTETTTFGIRLRKEQRRVLKREEKIIETSHGPVRIKNGFDRRGNVIKTHIEFEDVKQIADTRNMRYRILLDLLRSEVAAYQEKSKTKNVV